MSKPNKQLSICFVALNSYNVFANASDVRHIGGAEVQQREIAFWFRKQGYRVVVVTKDHGREDHTTPEGIEIIQAYNDQSGWPLVRFFHPRWSGLTSALSRANTDVYYQRGSGAETGQVAAWCCMRRKKFVYACASEGDCTPNLPFIRRRIDRWIYLRGLLAADAVIAQTEMQKRLLESNFDRSSTVIRNAMTPPPIRSFYGSRKRLRVLWIGRLVEVKRVYWVLELAEKFSEMDFVVIGSANSASSEQSTFLQKSSNLPNLTYIERMDRDELFQEYSNADVLLNTSVVEGFPNTYIEAWYHGVPTICTYDPDGLVDSHGLGWTASNFTELVSAMDSWKTTGDDARSVLSKRVSEFAFQSFNPDKILPKMERLVYTLIQS